MKAPLHPSPARFYRNRRRLPITATACLGLLVAVPALAAVTVEGRSATFKNRTGDGDDQGRIDLRYEPGAVPVLDPRCGTGNVLLLTLATSDTDYREIELPCENWSPKSSGYLYRDTEGA